MSTFQPTSRVIRGTVQSIRRGPGTGQRVWSDLSQSDMTKMARLGSMLGRIAPKPGALVFLSSGRPSCKLNGTETVVFSAFDASTHLQIARVYFSETFASAVDFVDFIRRKFPFSISRIRTSMESPFLIDSGRPTGERFTSHLEAQGVVHSMIGDLSRDDLFSVFTQLSFVRVAGDSQQYSSNQDLMSEFITYLFYHNNYRTLPSLKGWTPVQKLNSFDGYEAVESFDPYAVAES
jgi:hypothetical protein